MIHKHNTKIQNKLYRPPMTTEQHKKKWVTFTYHNSTTRKITNLFHNTNIKIVFKTNNSIRHILNTQCRDNNQYMQNGKYRLTCQTCHKPYVGQSGRKIVTRYKEHVRYTKHNNPQSAYASHILQNT
jgi:hypothetical protein